MWINWLCLFVYAALGFCVVVVDFGLLWVLGFKRLLLFGINALIRGLG